MARKGSDRGNLSRYQGYQISMLLSVARKDGKWGQTSLTEHSHWVTLVIVEIGRN